MQRDSVMSAHGPGKPEGDPAEKDNDEGGLSRKRDRHEMAAAGGKSEDCHPVTTVTGYSVQFNQLLPAPRDFRA